MKKILTIALVIQSFVFGATTPSGSDVLKTLPSQKDMINKTRDTINIEGIEKVKPPMKEDQYAPKMLIESFKLTNVKHMDKGYLQSLIKEYKNKELSFGQIQKVTNIITKEYKKEGYFLSRAYIPVQNIENGVLEIALIEGKYNKFILKNNSNVKDEILQGVLDKAKFDEIAQLTSLENSLLNTSDLPGAKVTKVEVKPGSLVGTSDIVIDIDADEPYNGYVIADNHGSRYTGKNRLMAGVNVNSPLKIADKLSASALISNGGDLKSGRVSYGVPLFNTGAYTELGYSKVKYNLVDEYEDLDADGKSSSLDLSVKYPVLNTEKEKIDLDLVYEQKELKDYANSDLTGDKDIDSISISMNHIKDWDLKKLFVKTDAKATFTTGKLTIHDEASKTADENGADTAGTYNKIELSLNAQVVFDETYTLDTTLKYQRSLNDKNLDGNEDLSLGGESGVRFFPTNEQSGENGYVLQTELFMTLPKYDNLRHTLSVFYDLGKVNIADGSNTTFDSKTLQDYGVGYQAYYDSYFLKTYLAKAIGNKEVESEPDYGTKLLFQIGYVF